MGDENCVGIMITIKKPYCTCTPGWYEDPMATLTFNVRELERRSGPYCSLGSFGETGGPLALLPFVGRCSGAHGESTAVQQAAMDSEKFILKQC